MTEKNTGKAAAKKLHPILRDVALKLASGDARKVEVRGSEEALIHITRR